MKDSLRAAATAALFILETTHLAPAHLPHRNKKSSGKTVQFQKTKRTTAKESPSELCRKKMPTNSHTNFSTENPQ